MKIRSVVPAHLGCRFETLEVRWHLSVAKATAPRLHVVSPIARPIHYKSDGITPLATASPSGLTPSIIRSAYGVDNILFGSITGNGSGQTIAIIDAYDDPKMISSSNTSTSSGYITSDLYKFNAYYGLQQFGSGGPTFTKINQSGGTSYPAGSKSWSGEIALDVEWAHVIAPMANLVLVESTNASDSNIITAAAATAKNYPGVTAISMSFGGPEDSGVTSEDAVFSAQPSNHASVAFFASSGDDGKLSTGIEYPTGSPYVVSVGGTTLSVNGGSYVGESGWSGSGGGVSLYESKPSYQSSVTQSSTKRTTPDISIDADPNSGVPVYDSYGNGTATPWAQYGGTSLSSPMWAGLDAIINQGRALSGQSSMTTTQLLTRLYATPSNYFHDILSGSNGYAAGAGYDLVTGIGSPITNTLVPYLAGTAIGAPVLAAGFDSGISDSDGITNVAKPTFVGTTASTGTVTILVDGNAYATATADGSSYRVALGNALADGLHTITAAIGSLRSANSTITLDTVAPTISSTAFDYLVAAHSLTIGFSENVSATTSASDFAVTNTTTSSVAVSAIAYAASSNVVTLTFPSAPNGTLPTGVYSATADASSITDVAGNALSAGLNYSFFFLPGDANHDGKVDVVDLGLLSSNWQHAGDFTQGDFDYSGTVDVIDLGILSGNWQVNLFAPAATPSVQPTPTPTESATVASLANSTTSVAATPPQSSVTPFAIKRISSMADIDSLV